jgi:hypothetical protein
LIGCIDLDKKEIWAVLYAVIPILGKVKLASVEGSLEDGIEITFGVPGLRGKARFFLQGKWVCVELTAYVFGKKFGPKVFRLFPLPIWTN